MNKFEHLDEYKSILLQMSDIYEERNKEYGNSFSKLVDELGIQSAIGQVYHKMSRLINESKKDEIKEDTCLDLANYAVMTLMELRRLEGGDDYQR